LCKQRVNVKRVISPARRSRTNLIGREGGATTLNALSMRLSIIAARIALLLLL
jgi:hypothetical protein